MRIYFVAFCFAHLPAASSKGLVKILPPWNGRPSVGVLHGLDNHALKIMGQWNELTHLFVDGYGGGSFTMKGLSYILSPSLKSLSLGYVRHGIDFGVLADKCPNIETLCVTFSVPEPVMYMDNDCKVAALRRSTARECVPKLQGRIAELKHLKYVWLYDSQGSTKFLGLVYGIFERSCEVKSGWYIVGIKLYTLEYI
jgi:hypothetical protein